MHFINQSMSILQPQYERFASFEEGVAEKRAIQRTTTEHRQLRSLQRAERHVEQKNAEALSRLSSGWEWARRKVNATSAQDVDGQLSGMVESLFNLSESARYVDQHLWNIDEMFHELDLEFEYASSQH